MVTIVGLRIGSVTDRRRRIADAPSSSAASSNSFGTVRNPAEKTSIEKATLRHRFATETIKSGCATRKLVDERPRTIDNVPCACEKAYQISAAVISGRTHAAMTRIPTEIRIDASDRRIMSASAMPATLCPTIADPRRKTMVIRTECQNTVSCDIRRRFARPVYE